ncbi:anti-sigma factor family protein [candidate division KSB1 bacterium]
MSCTIKKEDLVAFFYNELDKENTEMLKEHIKVCSECREEIASFTKERNILKEWRVDVPKMEFAFIEEKRSLITKIKELLKLRPIKAIRIGYSFGGILALVLIILSLINFEFNYDESGISLSMSLFGRGETVEREYIQSLMESQQESIGLVFQVIAENDEKLKAERDIIISQLIREVQEQREADMQLIEQNISRFSTITAEKFKQNDELIGRLVYFTEENFMK